ncbi:DUF3367 domain-containing protein [Corynebacterium sp. TAE3-ERU12]|nr:DUF3367 domain-containing protein [Corynebacterium sp. TAE3-ERU12]
MLGWWVLLCLIAFIQSPGRIVADTKHDLTQNPSGFLSRSLTIWSEIMPLGQLQNQAYGYLFPQGAFFAAIDALPGEFPMWIAQAVWWSLVLCVAFTGFLRLAEAAQIGSRPGRILAALLYALSPRILTTVAAISSEAWPVALAPWIALPLLRVVNSPRPTTLAQNIRAVLLSALALVCTGAVNAVGTAAACVVAGLLLLFTAIFGPARRRAAALMAGWIGACIAVSLWWLIPLLLLGKYSPPFTDYIESAGVTTKWLNLTEVLRGTTSWAPFVSIEREGGNALVTEPVFVLATMAITAIGVLGLASASFPRRRLWWCVALVGVLIMASWTEPFGPLATPGQELLDGPLAALRNLHKFDPVLRIPLLLGVAHCASLLPFGAPREHWLRPEKHRGVIGVMVVVLVAVAAVAPAWSARLTPGQSFREVPAYWAQAAQWLDKNAPDSRTLVEPAMPFGDQVWGFTRDEPLQPLASTPWVVRDAVPLVPPEAIRGLDGVQEAISSGRSIPTLAATLRANGVGHVLVRHDARPSLRMSSMRGLLRTLATSPGFTRVAQFHGDADSDAPAAGSYPASRERIEIWQVRPGAGASAAAPDTAAELGLRIIDAADVPLVSGGPEVLPRLDEVDGSSPVRILAGEGAGTVTDTPTRRGRNYGEVVHATSGILDPDQDPGVENLVPDYPVTGVPLTSVAHSGQITASSSADEPYSLGGTQPEHGINALVDDDPTTYWAPTRGGGQADWVNLKLADGQVASTVSITAARVAARVQVRSGTASTSAQIIPGKPTRVSLPPGRSDEVRIIATDAPAGFALSEVRVESAAGTDITPARVPAVPDSSSQVQRWVLGQEIPEGTMRRLITVPQDMQVRVDSDICRSGVAASWTMIDGESAQCGETTSLTKGVHLVESQARWVALTGAKFFAPSAAEQDSAPVAGELARADSTRIIWRPVSVNAGMQATVGGEVLEPITVNGWQQGWVVPAGAAGAVSLSFPAQSWWRGAIIGGGLLAALMAVAALLWARRTRMSECGEVAADLPRIIPAVLSALTIGMVAGWPGLAAGGCVVAAAAVVRARIASARTLHSDDFSAAGAAAALLLMGVAVVASHQTWPDEGYAAALWPVQAAAAASLALVAVAQWRPSALRAGSSTSA